MIPAPWKVSTTGKCVAAIKRRIASVVSGSEARIPNKRTGSLAALIRWESKVDSIGLAGPNLGASSGSITLVLTLPSVTSCGTETKLAPCLEASAS